VSSPSALHFRQVRPMQVLLSQSVVTDAGKLGAFMESVMAELRVERLDLVSSFRLITDVPK